MNNKLYDFLIEAKKQTYANENVEKVSPSRKGSHDYHYQNITNAQIIRYWYILYVSLRILFILYSTFL